MKKSVGIRLKLILSTVGLITLSTVVLSAILLLVQYIVIVNKTNETSRVIAAGISSISIEGILQNKRSIVKDYIVNIKNSDIKGLCHISVLETKKKSTNDLYNYWRNDVKAANKGLFLDYPYDVTYKVLYKGVEKSVKLGEVRLAFVKKEVFDIFNTLAIIIAVISAFVLSGSTILMVKLGNRIVQPILGLHDGVKKMRQGNLSIKIEVKGSDEISRLSESFNELVTHFREKLQMQKFVSNSTVSMIKKSGEVERKGERKEIVVFFSDIRGFTSYSEKHQPEEVVEMLNKCLEIQTQIILKNGGDIDKYVGDEIMALFPDLESAVTAAIQIQKKLGNISKEIQIGIGINSGPAVVGNIGSSTRMDYTVIGDTVNLGARLCSNAEGGDVYLSEETKEKVSGFKFASVGPIKVKGKAKAISVFKVKS